jgi:arabinan endo-1,5-alpha-L-arabinosidase
MKKINLIIVILLLSIGMTACNQKEEETPFDMNQGIQFPSRPYQDDDHIMVRDQYAFYNIAGNMPQYWNSANVHDPAIIKEGDYYYVFSTDAQFGITTYKGIHIRKSQDLINWEWVGTALDLSSVQDQIDYVAYNRDGERVDFFWAPDIIKRPNDQGGYEYWLFYSNSSFGQRTSSMALAKSDHIEGPYVFDREILRTHQSIGGTPNAIDPAVFVETVNDEEKMYLSYGSWSSGIFIIELNPETGAPLIEQTLIEREVVVNTATAGVTVNQVKMVPASSDDSAFGVRIANIWTAEAPHIMKYGSYYYLFITNGRNLTYDYEVKVFRSESIFGPYVDEKGYFAIASTNQDNFRHFGNKLTDSYHFTQMNSNQGFNRGWAAIGHNTTLEDEGKHYFVSHYRGTFMDKDRFFLGVREMFFINDWPLIAPHRYVGPTHIDISNAFLQGDYQIHILDNTISNASLNDNIISIVNHSRLVHLSNERVSDHHFLVTGDMEGKWRVLENDLLEIEIEGKTYIGIFIPAFSYEKDDFVLSFSARSNEGVSIWGSRTIYKEGR